LTEPEQPKVSVALQRAEWVERRGGMGHGGNLRGSLALRR
jgi:hypothetical protein